MNAMRAVFDDSNDGNREVRGGEAVAPLPAIMSVARRTLNRFSANANGAAPQFRKGRIVLGSMAPSTSILADQLLRAHPIPVEPGFEGNPGISGGAWRNDEDEGNALVYLRFSEGTVDLPLHVHEYSDRFIAVADGFGLFHYMPGGEASGELRSVVVQAGDIVAFTRGLVHTFTAPVSDLVLLSYHAPYFEFEDPRQFTLSKLPLRDKLTWCPAGVVSG